MVKVNTELQIEMLLYIGLLSTSFLLDSHFSSSQMEVSFAPSFGQISKWDSSSGMPGNTRPQPPQSKLSLAPSASSPGSSFLILILGTLALESWGGAIQ